MVVKNEVQKARVRKPSISLLTRTDDRLEERHSGPGRVGVTCHGEESGTQGAAPVDVGRQTPRGAEVSVHVPERGGELERAGTLLYAPVNGSIM